LRLVALAWMLLLGAACAPERPVEQALTGADLPGTTDSVYGTPPDPIPDLPPLPPSASPTGREPRLLWTPARQGVWSRMVQDNHPRYQHIRSKCDRARAGSPVYGDRGLWCALVYQMTGDVGAARIAWGLAGPLITSPPPNANDVRENFLENAILFDWLYPALTPAEVTAAIAGLNAWGNYVLAIGTPQYVGGIRTSDSDATVGYYFGLALTDLATRGMPGHVDWLSQTQTGGPGTLPVGGVIATGINRSTARNAIAEFTVARAAGGQWIESGSYDLGTIKLLALGAEAVRTAVAPQPDPFPEVRDFLRAAADFNTQIVTSDLNQALQWGDEEHPRDFQGRLFKRVTALGVVAGVIGGTVEGSRAMGLIDALSARYGEVGYGSAEPWARFYLTYDPYASRGGWDSRPEHVAPGGGHVVARVGGTLFSGMLPPRVDVDHELDYLGNFQLYRNGEWAITNPLGYGGSAVQGESSNGVLLAGLSSMREKGLTRVERGSNWWAITGTTSGPKYAAGYYDPPPAFVESFTRTIVYIQRAGVDHIITVDRVRMSDPRTLPRYDRYRTSDRARMDAALGLFEWIVHSPVAATTVSANRWRWSTPGGQPVVVTSLGQAPTAHVLSEAQLAGFPGTFRPSEIKHQLRLVPAYSGGDLVVRNVISVGADSPTISVNGEVITIGGTQITVTATGVQVAG
jgi:hypothetical protein